MLTHSLTHAEYLSELESPNWQNKFSACGTDYFGTDYFGRDICNHAFINSIEKEHFFDYPDWLYAILKDVHGYNQHALIIQETNLGGASGGNCYGQEATHYDQQYTNECIGDHAFQSIFQCDLQKIPQYSFFETITEYYGNYTNYEYFFVLKYDLIRLTSRKAKIARLLADME